MTLVFLFPGQSSRYRGMHDKLAALHAPCGELLERASDLLSWDLVSQFALDNEESYARNVDVQVGVFLANAMFLRIAEDHGLRADVSLGLSLGEYNHLVHIGALNFDDALLAVRARGDAYDAGPQGMMASVAPLDLETLQEVVCACRSQGSLDVVNLNSPTQNVIAGDVAAVEEALRVLEDEHYVQPVVIERRVPMHASMFAPVGDAMRPILASLPFSPPRRTYIPNRLGRPLSDPGRETFVDLLCEHVHHPVLWRQSIDAVIERHPDAVFVEVGPMAVLHNLLHRKWVSNRRFTLDSREDTAAHLDRVFAELLGVRQGASLAVAS